MNMDLNNHIKDMEDHIQRGRIKILPLYKNSKIPEGEDYFNKNYTINELKNHDGNFGIIAGANHSDCSIAIIDIDGYTLPADEDETKVAEVKQATKDFIFECLKDIPDALWVKTQSGGYHIYLWNKTVANKKYETSKNLYFPVDFEISELAGKSLAHSIEIFTKEGTIQCVLPGSTILDEATGKKNTYEIISEINCFADIGQVDDINATVRDTLINHGFTYGKKDEDTSKIESEQKFIKLEPKYDFVPNLIELDNDKVSEVANIMIPIFKICNGAKHYIALALGGYFSRTITRRSAECICDYIVNEIGNIFDDSEHFINSVLNNYESTAEEKTGLPTIAEYVKSFDKNFNEYKFIYNMDKICKDKSKHDFVLNEHSDVKKTYLSINYDSNTIGSYTWNKAKDGTVFYSNIHDILNLAPVKIYESYNILDKNSSADLCFTFYRNGMPQQQTIKGNDIESLEKQLAKRPGIVLKPREYKGLLNEIINEYIKLGLIAINEEIPIEGVFINPRSGELCRRNEKGSTEINKPDKESVKEGLKIWSKLKDVYPGDTEKLSHVLRYGLLCPFSYILKTEHKWLELLYLYGPSRTSKTTLAEIALCPFTSIDEEVSIGGGSFDTPYRIGKVLSRQGVGVIINEPSPRIEEGEPREIIKRAVESKISREKEDKGEHVKIPAYSNMIITANSFLPTHDAFVRRTQYLEFTKEDRLSEGDIKKFSETFHHSNWNNTDFLKLRAVGDYVIWFISENLDILEKKHSEIVDSMLDSLLEFTGEDKTNWEWIYNDAELMEIEHSDKEILNQFRRMVLHDNTRLNSHKYSATPDGDESDYEEGFKFYFIESVRKQNIDYLYYSKTDSKEYIIVNSSVKNALNEFCNLQVTCKGLASYMDFDYKVINFSNKSIKGFRIEWQDFKTFLDGLENENEEEDENQD